MQRLIDAVPLPQAFVDAGGRVEAMNTRAQRLFGDAMQGRHYSLAVRQPALLERIETALTTGAGGQARYLSREGQRDTTWNVAVSPLALPDGDGVLLTFEDETAAEQASQIRRDFVANVSHELRTPLTAVLGFIETLRGAARHDPAAQERFLQIMEQEAERMNRLVDDLLSLSRVESEERVRPRGTVEIGGVLSAVASALRNIAAARDIRIELAGAGRPVELAGDADQLFQVFANLVENAVKYGGDGGTIRVAVTTTARDPVLRGPAAVISVGDEGPGIDELHIPRLTERFYRVDTHRSRELGGTGLGLAIVKHIVNRHRGRLRIASEVGRGSTFTVVLPMEAAGPEIARDLG